MEELREKNRIAKQVYHLQNSFLPNMLENIEHKRQKA